MRLIYFIASVLVMTGCGGGGGTPPPSLTGTWTRVAIGQAGQSESALVTCPNFVSVGGTTVSCRASDQVSFNTDATLVVDMSNAEGRPTRTWGGYRESDGRVSCTMLQRGTDYDLDGVFSGPEITTPVFGALSMNIRQLSATKLLVEITLDGLTHTGLYEKNG